MVAPEDVSRSSVFRGRQFRAFVAHTAAGKAIASKGADDYAENPEEVSVRNVDVVNVVDWNSGLCGLEIPIRRGG